MRIRIAAILTISTLSAGCASAPEDAARRSSGGITKAQAVKAFSDAVLGHCLPAIHREEAFSQFEVDGVTPIGALWENRTSLFQDESLPVYQMANGVVQLQLDPYNSCQTVSNDLPVQATFDLIGDALVQTNYGYREQDSGYPQKDGTLSRIFVSGERGNRVTVALTGRKAGAASTGSPYSSLSAAVTTGPLNE